jgi:NAD(P)-dependent dehydrogenase (short-subunit alcohol dehydrogenase family)
MSAVALVTGTSSGIGLHASVLLAQAGFTVVATMRNTRSAGALMAEAKGAGVELDVRQLDVQDAESVNQCVRATVAAHGRIDLLVNNAGSGFLAAFEETSFRDLTNVMNVNFFGVWRVTQAVFPLMRAAGSGRIITNTSIGGLIGQPFNDAYCAAKFACEGMMESLAPVAARFGVHVSILEPGPVHTEFVATVRGQHERLEPSPASSVYDEMRASYLAATSQVFEALGQTGAEVGRVIVDIATAEKPHLRYPTSETVRAIVARKYTDPTGDSIVAMTGARLGGANS